MVKLWRYAAAVVSVVLFGYAIIVSPAAGVVGFAAGVLLMVALILDPGDN